MFKHILVPTDGSSLAAKGVKSGVRLAKALGARVTGAYVIEPYLPPMVPEAAVMATAALDPRDYEKRRRRRRSRGSSAKRAARTCAARRSSSLRRNRGRES